MKPNKAAARRLKRARALIAKPYGWTKKTSQTTVHTTHGWVTAYCMTGAVDAVVDGSVKRTSMDVFLAAAARPERQVNAVNARSIVQSENDRKSTTKRHVLELFDRAIAIANGEAQA